MLDLVCTGTRVLRKQLQVETLQSRCLWRQKSFYRSTRTLLSHPKFDRGSQFRNSCEDWLKIMHKSAETMNVVEQLGIF